MTSPAEQEALFDRWAKDYDAAVTSSSLEGSFPFDGYERILDEVLEWADVRPSMRVLDLGIGTGNLASRFVGRGCEVWGVDFSAGMLADTRVKLPEAHLVQADLLREWPEELLKQPFDRVVSAYVLHEFDFPANVRLLQQVAARLLSPDGGILIADIAFPTTAARMEASQRWASLWDESEDYWAAEEAIAACTRVGLRAAYRQISFCGGLFRIVPCGT
ncbi:MAG: methyltransferase domain-containing protein [Deltaproteobacteria bacterium]|nr:methyltransferase domain-containing protein [Deltaproteobacteria bacterium]